MEKIKIEYLREIYKEENDRHTISETKLSQIISNSGVFLTVTGIIITILINSSDILNLYVKAILVLLVIGIVFCYIKSMTIALDGLNPLSFCYQKGNPDTVNDFNDEKEFNEEIIADYISSIKVNSESNNQKFNCLIDARSYFVKGLYITGGMIIGLILYIAFISDKPKAMTQKIEVISTSQNKQLSDIRKSIDSLRFRQPEITTKKIVK